VRYGFWKKGEKTGQIPSKPYWAWVSAVQFFLEKLDTLDTSAANPYWAWVSGFRRNWTLLDKTGHMDLKVQFLV
jgi:hypothetical protein